MPDIVCLDTNILIWGLKKQASIGQEPNIPKAEYLIETLVKNKARVVIPSIVVGEAAINVPDKERSQFISVVSKMFQVVPFDTLAAAKYPLLFLRGLQDEQARSVIDGISVGKRAIKNDCMILATALAVGVNCLYTADASLTSRASLNSITVFGLPDVPPRMIPLPLT